jgi:hypothetical protein
MGLFNRKPRHQHRWRCIRVSHIKLDCGYSASELLRTVGMWKCTTCGEVTTDERLGIFSLEDLNNDSL